MLRKLAQLKHITKFCNFLEKITILTLFKSLFARFFKAIWNNLTAKIQKQVEEAPINFYENLFVLYSTLF